MKSSAEHALKQIAVDGSPASGKTTIGKMLAEKLGFRFLDTGLMYRAVTLVALRRSVGLDDVEELGKIACVAQFEVKHLGERDWRLMVNGEDLTDRLHAEQINRSVSKVAAVSEVRRALVRQQREIADLGPIVMAGQDIGTKVLSDAPLKIFLVASTETRARRRTEDSDGNIDGKEYEEVLRSIQRRNKIDSNREDSPLRPADDAKIVDNGSSTPEEVMEEILSMIGASEKVPPS